MNPILATVYALSVVVLLRQFGARMSPSRSLGWWLTFVFLGVAVVHAESYQRLAAVLGFQLVSNFIFAALMLLMMFELVTQASFSTKTARQLRRLVAEQAAASFLNKHSKAPRAKALVVVPCFNEEQALLLTIPRLRQLQACNEGEIQICLVDDGSRDRTWSVLREAAEGLGIVRHSVNIGVGGVLLTAFGIQRELGLDFVIQCDADGQHPIDEIPELLRQARKDQFDLLIGSRFQAPSSGPKPPRDHSSTLSRRFGGLVIQGFLGLFGRRAMVADPTSGFRVFSQRLGGFLLDEMPDEYPEPETVALAALGKLRIGEFRVAMAQRVAGVSSIGGLSSIRYMYKVVTALLGLRLRSFKL